MSHSADAEILQKLAIVAGRYFRVDPCVFTAETTAMDIDGWDSLSHTLLLMHLEKAFGITLNGSEAGNARNVGELVTLIQLAQEQSAP